MSPASYAVAAFHAGGGLGSKPSHQTLRHLDHQSASEHGKAAAGIGHARVIAVVLSEGAKHRDRNSMKIGGHARGAASFTSPWARAARQQRDDSHYDRASFGRRQSAAPAPLRERVRARRFQNS